MLKVECESCKAPYQVDERRVPQTGLKMRCPKCGHTFLVTDPSKGPAAGGAGGGIKAPSPKKATMVGFGPGGAPPPAMRPPPAAAPAPRPPVDDDAGLPAVKPAPGRVVRPIAAPAPKPAPAPAPAPAAARPKIDELDLPELAHHADLPAPVRGGGVKVPPPVAPSSPTPGFGFEEVDLPSPRGTKDAGAGFGEIDLPSPVTPPGGFGAADPAKRTPGFGDIDLPSPLRAAPPPAAASPRAARSFGDVDLPSPKAGGRSFGEVDLPTPLRGAPPDAFGSPKLDDAFGDLDLPSPKGGFDDLPALQNDLPIVGGATLPMAKAGGFGEIDLPSLQNDLPQAMSAQAHLPVARPGTADLPQAMSAQAHLPSPMSPQAHLPSPVGPSTHLPSPVSDDRLLPNRQGGAPPPVSFGELDLPLVGGGPAPAPPPAGAPRAADPVSFGELDLPPDPSLIGPGAGPAFGGGGLPMSGGHGGGGGMGFGEVDLGGGEAGPVAGPPPATSAGSFAFQEASLEAPSGAHPARQRPAAPVDRAPSKAPRVLGLLVALVVVGGAALQFTPVGAFGHVFISEMLHKGDYAKNAALAGDNARKLLAADTFASAQKAADDLVEARKRSPRSKPLAATAAFFEYVNQVRFGTDAARAARAKTFLGDMTAKDEVPYFFSAQAAEAAAGGDWPKAKQLLDTAATRDPKDGIRQDQAILRGEIALAQRDTAAAIAAFTEAQSTGPTARTSFGIARAHHLAKAYPKAREAVDATLKASPNHAGARTLRASLTWELERDAESALKDLDAVLSDAARKSEGPAEVSAALAAKGWIMHARERASEARAAFDEAVKIDPRNVAALVGQGESLYSDGRFTEALTRFEEGVSKDAANVPAIIGAAKTKIALERLSDAKTQLTAARARWPKDMGIALWLAKTEEALGNKKVAEELYGTAIDLADPGNPESIEAYAGAARFLASQGRTVEAQAKLDQARSKLPDTPALQRAFGDVAAAQGLYDQAISHYQAALEKNPADLGTRFRLGVTYRRMNMLDKAAEEFDKVVAIDKEYPGIALERGALFEASGEMQKALEQFSAAFQKAPNDTDLKLRIGAAYVTIGDVDKALPLLKQVYDQRPNSAEANHFLGRAYLKQGGLESAAAMRYLERAVDLDPNRAEYHLYVAWAANEASPAQLGLARKSVDKALELDKLLADGYWQRGVVELREGSLAAAIKDLKKALELKPSRHEAHAALAETYEQKNDTPGAMAEWAKAIAGDAEQPTWRWRYGKLLADKGKTAEAAKHLAFAVEKGKSVQPRPGWLVPAAFEAGEALRKTGKKTEACDDYRLFMELAAPTHPDRRDALKGMSESGCPQEP